MEVKVCQSCIKEIQLPKIQVNITDEANNILLKLNQKNTKSIFIDLAIKNFFKSKEAKLFLALENEDDKFSGSHTDQSK